MSADWKQMQTHVVPSARSVSPHAFFAVFSFSFYLEFFLHTQGLQTWCYRTQCHSTAIPNVPSGDLKCMDGLIFCNVIHQWLHQRLLLQDMLRVFCAHGWHTASVLLPPFLDVPSVAESHLSSVQDILSQWWAVLSVWFVSCRFFTDSLTRIQENVFHC